MKLVNMIATNHKLPKSEKSLNPESLTMHISTHFTTCIELSSKIAISNSHITLYYQGHGSAHLQINSFQGVD